MDEREWIEDYPIYNLDEIDFVSDERVEIQKLIILSKSEREAKYLMEIYPPQNEYPRKKYLFYMASNENIPWKGLVKFSRFKEMKIPKVFPFCEMKVNHISQENVYTYHRLEGYDERKQRDWHVNFADKHLFGYYYGPLFAQDEIQAAEMPVLASLSEWLKSDNDDDDEEEEEEEGEERKKKKKNPELCGMTRFGKFSSPCLIRNVERRISVSLDPNESEGRPNGLYGKNFFFGDPEAIEKATHVFQNPQLENIIAMEAPSHGKNKYDIQTIIFILKTAYTGFMAAKYETFDELGENSRVCVHTGNWGTGAYGGNKIIMALLQLGAAELAMIDSLVFHSFSNLKPYEDAKEFLKEFFFEGKKKNKKAGVLEFIRFVHSKNFQWGVSDGN